MTESRSYQIHLEKKLIEQFRQNFFNKIGYYPIVLTKIKVDIGRNEYISMMSLETLADCFTPFLPTKYEKIIPLGSKRRYREIVELRCMFCSLAKSMNYTLKSIGSILGDRDHTTAINSINTFHDLIETNDGFKQKYITLLNYIKQNQPAYESSVMDDPYQVLSNTEPDFSA